MDMMLNSLPSRTWNRLNINDSFISISNELAAYTPQVSGNLQDGAWTLEGSVPEFWSTIATGMGADTDVLMQDSPISTLVTKPHDTMDTPLVLNYTYADDDCNAHRLYIDAAPHSHVNVVLVLQSESEQDGGISAIQTKITAQENSQVHIYVVQLLGKHMVCLNDVSGICEENASVTLTKLELGAGKLYAGTRFDLKGNHSAFTADVGYMACENQTMDMNYIANHFGRKTNSLMEVSGTLEEGARKVFRGSIDFKRGSKGSVGTENENVLLLGDNMINKTIPLILCQEEDVEGNHGASIGRLDEKVLFYLGTRGIAEDEAQRIIERSRIESICTKIPDECARQAVMAFGSES